MDPTILERIEIFDQAAQHWGWQRDQGYDDQQIETARLNYEGARADLITAIEKLGK